MYILNKTFIIFFDFKSKTDKEYCYHDCEGVLTLKIKKVTKKRSKELVTNRKQRS